MTGDDHGKRDIDPHAAGQPAASDGLDRLWAPWRFGYVSGEADKPRLEGCPFCVLPDRDPSNDRESLILHRGERAYVIANAYPYNPGHLMVIPYSHEANLEMLDADTSDEIWGLVRRSVAVLKERMICQGVNLGANLGSEAGAGIAPHLHMHVVPRWGGDTNFISVIGAARVLPQALDEVYERLLGAWD
ncbi:MAG: ATP adenylyltransferase [Glaciecola sp.]